MTQESHDTAARGRLRQMSVYFNGYKPVALWKTSTSFRSTSLKYRTQSDHPEQGPAEEFLVASRFRRSAPEAETSIQSYFTDATVEMLSLAGAEPADPGAEVPLPAGTPLDMALGEALAQRRSRRLFTGDPVEAADLACLLRAAQGITAEADVGLQAGGTATLAFRTTPSGGGLYPVDLFLGTLNVTGQARGVYRYNPVRDVLCREGDGDLLESVTGAFGVPEELLSLSQAGAVLLFAARPWRSMRKYGSRGLRFVFHEIGAMTENIHLAAAALGLGTVDCASYFDAEMDRALGLDGVYRTVLHTLVLGVPAE
ncbi:SagB/ThcOx family dehydrogenase [Psychromarinibacter sp. C21-152]|uniref:SagB/ThcOx family dehydrogenase n=1 Tax=Psychromarinibacter sediminicola TaxID=3033385 RepID=A0AAE3TBD2_9RHOB|nr:SagB/ThcOx family dehydrogenase [Psychromarinibacter sediminicola]MDF0602560.1 SagB/ThcOx family dehydrogenase [Psychromarinibacter sediminicola]